MKKIGKKLIAVTALASLGLTSLLNPVSAKIVTSTDSNRTSDPSFPNLTNVVLYQDFESGHSSLTPVRANNAAAATVDSGNDYFGMVRQIDAKDATQNGKDITQTFIPVADSSKFETDASKGRVALDFDVMLNDMTQNYYIMLRDSAGVDFGFFMFDCKGNIYFAPGGYLGAIQNGKGYEDNGVNGGTYTPGTWNHISAVITPNGIDTTIDYYIDGKYITTATEDFWRNHSSDNKDKITGSLARYFVFTAPTYINGEDQAAVKSETALINIDNVCVSYADQYDNFYASEPTAANGKITVRFNEALASDNKYDQIKVVGLDGTEKTKKSVSVYDRELTIEMNDALSGGEGYAVVVPTDFMSVTGHKLSDTAMSFIAPTGFNTVFEQNFDSKSIGSVSYPEGFEGTQKMFGSDFNVAKNPDDSKSGNAIYVDGTTTGAQMRFFGYDTVSNDQAYMQKYFGEAECITASEDFYFDELSHTPSIYVWGFGEKRLADAYFDGSGNFVVKKVISGNGNVYYKNSYDFDLSKNTVFSGIKTKKWYTVKSVINFVDKTVSWYLVYDGQEHFVASNAFLEDATVLRDVRLVASTVNSVSNNAGKFYLDNFKFENSNLADIKKTVTEQTGEPSTSVDFTAQSASVPDEYVLSFDISTDKLRPTTDGTANGDKTSPTYRIISEGRYDSKNTPDDTTDDAVPALYFQMNDKGQLVMEKSFNSFWSDAQKVVCPAVESAKDGNFNVKFYINKGATKNVSVYVDDVFVRRLGLGWGVDNNSATSTAFPYDGKTVSEGYHKFTQIAVSEATENTTISNAKIGLTKVNLANDITLTDTFNKSYKIQSNRIPGNVKTIAVKYNSTLPTDITSAECKLTSDSAEVSGLTNSVSGDTITVTVPDGTYFENGKTYDLTLSGIADAKDLSTQFTINDNGTVTVSGLAINAADNKISASLVVDNKTSVEKKCILLVAEYDAEQKQMLNVKPMTITAAPYSTVTIDSSNNSETEMDLNEGHKYKAFVLSGFDNLYPLTNFVER